MNARYSREDLIQQLQDVLDLSGANAARWPERSRARLAAFVESNDEAARLFAEARALDKVLSHAPKGSPRLEIEARIMAAASSLPQSRGGALDGEISPAGRRRDGAMGRAFMPAFRPSLWGGAALLAASLVAGIFIGLTGQAVPALRSVALLASSESDAGIAFSGSLFEPSGIHEQGEL